jgi:D-xylose transport system permease protein
MTVNITDGSEESAASARPITTDEAPATASSERRAIPILSSLTRGNFGQIPVFIGLVVISIYFQIAGNGFFLTPDNLTNLVQQIITMAIVSLGAVLVLLIGEIDLSLSAVAFLCGGIMGVLSARHGLPAYEAIAGALLAGLIVGAINGFLIAVVRMPSFIVTLGAFIGYQGLLSQILQPQTTLPIRDDAINNIAIYSVPDYLGVGLPIAAVALYAISLFIGRALRLRAGLAVKSVGQIGFQIGAVAVITAILLTFFEGAQGVPVVAVIFVGLIILLWLILQRTRFGRHIYAVGGSAEAARRAGINVVGLRIVIFSLASMLAAIGGVLLVSREVSAPAQVDSRLLLDAIAAAVIGGVSLFGGRGSVWGVVLGALIVGSLLNGLALTHQTAAVQEMAEGAVLILAVFVDALARRRSATGLR